MQSVALIVVSLLVGFAIAILWHYALLGWVSYLNRRSKSTKAKQIVKTPLTSQGEEEQPVMQSNYLLPRVCTWRPSEQRIWARRQKILCGRHDPTALVLQDLGYYMSPAEVSRYCRKLHFFHTRAEIAVLLEALVIVQQAKRKKSRQGFWVYKWIA